MDDLEEINNKLRNAAVVGDYKKVVEALGEGADVDSRDEFRGTALLGAARNRHEEIAKLLIDNGAGVNVRDTGGFSALILAAFHGQKGIVELLIDAGADVGFADSFGRTALISAAMNGHKEIVEILLPLSGGLERLKRQMKNDVKQEKDPEERLELKIKFSKLYKEIVSMAGKKIQLEDVKTAKLPGMDRENMFRKRMRRTGK